MYICQWPALSEFCHLRSMESKNNNMNLKKIYQYSLGYVRHYSDYWSVWALISTDPADLEKNFPIHFSTTIIFDLPSCFGVSCPALWVCISSHDDVIKWKHFPRYWPFVRGIHRSPVKSQHKGQWRGALMFSLICVWINGWVNNREAGDLRCNRAHYDVIVMLYFVIQSEDIW